jgi:hypothetical protein
MLYFPRTLIKRQLRHLCIAFLFVAVLWHPKPASPQASPDLPATMAQCEPDSCATWTFHGKQGVGRWLTGPVADLTIEHFDSTTVSIYREDKTGAGQGIKGHYVGTRKGDHIEGSFTWTWPGHGPLSSGNVNWIATIQWKKDDSERPIPGSLEICEGAADGCTGWSFHGQQGHGEWLYGTSANLWVEHFDEDRVAIRRADAAGAWQGLVALYTGVVKGHHIEGTMSWLWPGHGQFTIGTVDWHATIETIALRIPSGPRASLPMACNDGGHSPADSQRALEIGNQAATARNDTLAASCFLLAAQQGNASAQYDIAYAYKDGIGIPANAAEAVRWFREAAGNGNTSAQAELTWFGPPVDKLEADSWRTKMSELRDRHSRTCSQLSVMHAMSLVELGSVSDNAGGLLALAAQAFMGIKVEMANSCPKLVMTQGADQPQAHGRFHSDLGMQTGDFLCAGIFLRGHPKSCQVDDPSDEGVKVCADDDAGVDAKLNEATAKALLGKFPWFKEEFRLRPLSDGRYRVTLVPTSIQLSKTYSAVTDDLRPILQYVANGGQCLVAKP